MTDSIPLWSVERGIGHVVLSRHLGSALGTRLACGIIGNMRGFQTERPKRICKRCREAVEQGLLRYAKGIK